MINFMKFKRNTYLFWLISVLAVIAVVLIIYFMASKSSALPTGFLAARANAAAVSQKIVDLTTATNQRISEVNDLDAQKNVSQALSLIQEARTSNNEAYAEASSLAVYLEQMASGLNGISSRARQQLAYEAVATEFSLISEFIVYTQQLNGFLDSLSQAIATNSFQARQNATQYLAAVNGQANKINSFNSQFLAKMSAFDTTP